MPERIYHFSSNCEKERKKEREIYEFEMDLNNLCLCPNLSNDDIISVKRPGLKTGVENYIFWSEIGSGFGEPGGTPSPRISRSTPPES